MRSVDARVPIAILIAIRLVDKRTVPRANSRNSESSTGNALPAGQRSSISLIYSGHRFDFGPVRFFLAKIARNARTNRTKGVSIETE